MRKVPLKLPAAPTLDRSKASRCKYWFSSLRITALHPVAPSDLISQQVLIKSFCKSRLPHRSVFFLVTIKDSLTDSCGNCLLQIELINTSCEIRWVKGVSLH